MEKRETFSSRLGFLLISAGCAIGLGNIWRFPYITGQYGGAAFVIIYLMFLVILGMPIMVMEFSVGRGSRKGIARSFHVLEPEGSKWHIFSWFCLAGNYLLMMFYTVIAGWLLLYCIKIARGDFLGLDATGVSEEFNALMGQPVIMIVFTVIVIAGCLGICSMGLQNGVERITKVMMICLLAVLVILVIRAVTLPGASKGLEFYLKPNLHNLMYDGNGNFVLGKAIYAAMGQSFFTFSIGVGSMAIFGSYIGKEHRLGGEAVRIGILDTFVALMSGLIIFPSCFAYGVSPDSGPNLIFVTLPNIFNEMSFGRLWGTLFFIFLSFAALSTVIAVFENIICFWMDRYGWSRHKSVLMNLVLLTVLSLPCVLGFNLWSSVTPLGEGSTIMDLEDFLISDNLLPLGSIVYLLFCTRRYGWGWDNFMEEANTGDGLRFPGKVRFYVSRILPLIMALIFLVGYWNRFGA